MAEHEWIYSLMNGVASEGEFDRYLKAQEDEADLGNLLKSDYQDLMQTDKRILESRLKISHLHITVGISAFFTLSLIFSAVGIPIGLICAGICYWAWRQIKTQKELLIMALTARKNLLQKIGSSKRDFKNGKLDGPFKEYSEYGKWSEGFYKNGKLDGLVKSYYRSGELEVEGVYKDGFLDGPFKAYHKNGKLCIEKFCKSGWRDGAFKEYYENGQLKEDSIFKQEVLDGPQKAYYENGQLESEAVYKDGKPEGLFRSYYEKGQLKGEGSYKNGELEGLLKSYFENGQLKQQRVYKDGKEDGLVTTYYENGKLKSEEVWNNGIGKTTKEYSENGNLIVRRQ